MIAYSVFVFVMLYLKIAGKLAVSVDGHLTAYELSTEILRNKYKR
jgi:hypothetical protein